MVRGIWVCFLHLKERLHRIELLDPDVVDIVCVASRKGEVYLVAVLGNKKVATRVTRSLVENIADREKKFKSA